MTTGLEALNDIRRNCVFVREITNSGYKYGSVSKETDKSIDEQCNAIEKELKALEIIIKKTLTNCNLALVKDNVHYKNYCREFEYFLNKYNESPNGFEITKEDLLTQEEFDLLKEVLEND